MRLKTVWPVTVALVLWQAARQGHAGHRGISNCRWRKED